MYTSDMDISLADRWAANERAIQDALDLKSGEADPVSRVEGLDADQDVIEYEIALRELEHRRSAASEW